MMNVKVCGLTNLADALVATEAGVWALGFNFYKPSPRYVSYEKAKTIMAALPGAVKKVGIFVNATYAEIAAVFTELKLDLAQVNHDIIAPPSFKQRLILSLHIHDLTLLPTKEVLGSYRYLLLDAPRGADNLWGGTGRLANWQLAKHLVSHYRLILSGGLTALNVQEAITTVKPFAVDVASGVEQSPGIKNTTAIKHFLECCKNDN